MAKDDNSRVDPLDVAVGCGKRFALAIAFGVNCRSGFHLKRVYDKRVTTSCIFDSQITLYDSILHYVENDFRGLYELEDMEFVPETGQVRNRLTDALHVHEFHGAKSQSELAGLYEEPRRRHDYLCEKARRIFRQSGPLFLFISGRMSQSQIDRIAEAVKKTYPNLRFRLIPEPADDKDPTHSGDLSWQGDYRAWDRHLAKYRPVYWLALRIWFDNFKTKWGRKFTHPPVATTTPPGL